MAPFANALLDEDELDLRVFKSAIASDDAHNIQTHVVNLQLYVSVVYCLITIHHCVEKIDVSIRFIS